MTVESNPQNKLLVLVDGSDRSINTVRYVARNHAFHSTVIVLFHVLSAIPECYRDMEMEIKDKKTATQSAAWGMNEEKIINNYMLQAKQLLMKSGVAEEFIEIKVRNQKAGIARDIIREARSGYAAVVARRRGVGALRGLVLGSVAAKLIEKIDFLPLILVGKRESGNTILLGFDGSEDAIKAVDFVGATLGAFDYKVKLLYVVRSNREPGHKKKSIFPYRDFFRVVADDIKPSFQEAAQRLVSWGFSATDISTKVLTGKMSCAKTIVDYAREHNFGTIVMGRKGRNRAQDFFIGRVTNKVIHMARSRSVWIIH